MNININGELDLRKLDSIVLVGEIQAPDGNRKPYLIMNEKTALDLKRTGAYFVMNQNPTFRDNTKLSGYGVGVVICNELEYGDVEIKYE